MDIEVQGNIPFTIATESLDVSMGLAEPILINMSAEGTEEIPFTMMQFSESVNVELDSVLRLHHGYDYYTGSYVVTPKAFDEQTLYTQDLMMSDDVLVHRVPFYETHNDTGTTIYIAEE